MSKTTLQFHDKIKNSMFTFKSVDNVEIYVSKWSALNAPLKAAVQIAHGLAEHSQRYTRFAEFLNAAGYVVYANDHRGHGLTAMKTGRLGIAGPDAWNKIVTDARKLTAIIKQDVSDRPVFLFGHSMGSMLVQDYIARWGENVSGAVLCGTSGLFANLENLIQALTEAVKTAPDDPSVIFSNRSAAYNKQFKASATGSAWLSRDENEIRKYVDDPLCGFQICNRLALDYLKGARDMWDPGRESRIPRDLPVLVITGEKDPVGDNGSTIRLLLERYRSYGLKHLQSKFYADTRHELLNEINRDEVSLDVLTWMNQWRHARR